MIEGGIHSLLIGDSVVGSLVGTRVYPLSLPQNPTVPCLTYSTDTGQESSSYDGQGTFSKIELQVDSWAASYSETLTIAQAVKSAIKNYAGVIGGVNVQHIKLVSAVSVFEEGVDLYRTSQAYTVYVN